MTLCQSALLIVALGGVLSAACAIGGRVHGLRQQARDLGEDV